MNTIQYDRNETAVIIPDPDESFVIPTIDTPELVLVNSNTPHELVCITPTDDGTFDVSTHYPDEDSHFVDYQGVPLQKALGVATDMQAFRMTAGGEVSSMFDVEQDYSTFTLDPQGNGGLLVNDVEQHFPIHLCDSDDSEKRIREANQQEYRAYENARYVYEVKPDVAANWESQMKGNQPVQPPIIFDAHFPDAFNVWEPRMDITIAQYVENLHASHRV